MLQFRQVKGIHFLNLLYLQFHRLMVMAAKQEKYGKIHEKQEKYVTLFAY